MRMVIDANYFQDAALQHYLREPENRVVFPDVACMEAYKGEPVRNVCKSLEIVRRHPRQVQILKPTREIIRMQSISTVAIDDLIDWESTAAFPDFCLDLDRAAVGERTVIAALEEHGRVAQTHFDAMLADARTFVLGTKQVSGFLGDRVVRALRSKRAELPDDYGEKVVNMVLQLAGELFKSHPDVESLPRDLLSLRESLIFRNALAGYLLCERMIANGGGTDVKHDRIRNDVVDMLYVAYATFFDGLLTRETKVTEIHEEARWFLSELFVAPTAATPRPTPPSR